MAVRRTDLAFLIQSRAFGSFRGPGSWRSSCLDCGLLRSTPEVLSRAPGAEITPDRKTHTAQPMALENFRNRCVLWMSILILFIPFGCLQSSFFFPCAPTGAYSLFFACSPSLSSALSELRGGGRTEGERVVWGRKRARERGGGGVAKKLCWFQPGALWKIWHPLLICSSKNPSGEGMLKEKKNPRIGQALKTWVLKAVDLHRSLF